MATPKTTNPSKQIIMSRVRSTVALGQNIYDDQTGNFLERRSVEESGEPISWIECRNANGAVVAILHDGDDTIQFDVLADTAQIFGIDPVIDYPALFAELGLTPAVIRAIDAGANRVGTLVKSHFIVDAYIMPNSASDDIRGYNVADYFDFDLSTKFASFEDAAKAIQTGYKGNDCDGIGCKWDINEVVE